VAKLSTEHQVPLGGMIGNDHFGELADIKEPMEEKNDTMEAQNDIEEDDNVFVEHDEFGIYDIVDYFKDGFEDDAQFCNFFMSYNCNDLTFIFENKNKDVSICVL
jgi:hypothetical protein